VDHARRKQERWRELCEQASVEQDPKKLLELVTEINRLLDEKKIRLTQAHYQSKVKFQTDSPMFRAREGFF
jgi:hypothetical protein